VSAIVRSVRPAKTEPSERVLRILICPDSFKGCLTAGEVAAHLKAGIAQAMPTATVTTRPLADGGEGTLLALKTVGATLYETDVSGPFAERVPALWAVEDGRAYVEVAQAIGAALVPNPTPYAALHASSEGVGELILAALDHGCEHITITLGGASTTDGGAGMIRALGARLLDRQGRPVAAGGAALRQVATVDTVGLDPRLTGTTFAVATDVDHPLLGQTGSAATFGPQKGAGPREVAQLQEALQHWVAVLDARGRGNLAAAASCLPGAGASGGLGFAAIHFLEARVQSGADLVLDLLGIDGLLRTSDLIVTAEGALDGQTLHGKLPAMIAARARRYGVPVVVVAGTVALDQYEIRRARFAHTVSLADLAGSATAAMAQAPALLEVAGRYCADWYRSS
jgi:glycerate kinase